MEFKSAFFAIIVVGMVILAAGAIIVEWGDDYGSGITYDLYDYDATTNVSDSAGVQQGSINPQSGEASSDFETETFRGGYGILTNIYGSFRIVFGEGGMVDSITDRFGIPDYFRQGLVTMMIIAITFSIIAVVFRLARRSA